MAAPESAAKLIWEETYRRPATRRTGSPRSEICLPHVDHARVNSLFDEKDNFDIDIILNSNLSLKLRVVALGSLRNGSALTRS